MITDEEAQKIKKIQRLLQSRLNTNSTASQSVYFSFVELKKEQLFENRPGLEKIFELIKQKTNAAIFSTIRKGAIPFTATTAASGPYEGIPVQAEIGVDISVSDPTQLTKYFESVFITRKESRTFIEYRDDGNFYCKGKLIKFPDPDDVYVKFFRIIFSFSDSSGFISYMDINRRLQAEKEPELTDPKEIMQRVRNAKYNLLRYVKGLPNMTPKREPLIEAVRGKGMIFRNPEQ